MTYMRPTYAVDISNCRPFIVVFFACTVVIDFVIATAIVVVVVVTAAVNVVDAALPIVGHLGPVPMKNEKADETEDRQDGDDDANAGADV